MLDIWGVDEKTLYETAYANTVNKYPVSFEPIQQILIKMMAADFNCNPENIPKELLEQVLDENEMPMYILSNKQTYYGATVLFYKDVLQKISGAFDSDLIIIPSSIHECIIIPDNGEYSDETLSEMVRDVNCTAVDDEEQLSDHIYKYDKKAKKLKFGNQYSGDFGNVDFQIICS